MTSKWGKNKNVDTLGAADCVTDVFTTFWRYLLAIKCMQFLNRRTETWDISVLYDKEETFINGDVIYASVIKKRV